nr:hypothetical protein [Sicyoidochytrium minutum DNA virus]
MLTANDSRLRVPDAQKMCVQG